MKLGRECLFKLLKDYQFTTVLDVGAGGSWVRRAFLANKKELTRIDYGKSVNYHKKSNDIVADYNEYKFDKQFDCIWCSHVLEHQKNVNIFLVKIFNDLKPGGVLAISIPPARPRVSGGHLTNWSEGLLLYNLVVAGFDCSEAKVKTYGYNISCILIKKERPAIELHYDKGDINRLKDFFPKDIKIKKDRFKANFNSPDW